MIRDSTRFIYVKRNLLRQTEAMKTQYLERSPSPDYEVDFYGEVKPFVDEVTETAEAWRVEAKQWIKEARPLYIHPVQVDKTVENALMAAVQCFHTKVRKTRFINTIEAIIYVLESIEAALQPKEQ
ncbi:YppE family protein [Bacillaceae bacterium SIJ1]|uniref:YppE family protein n=1 Tax=Litoribacterium kuwaitense TaxID=1398745 RepID=UPI0013EA43B4|nr:YppE family protein [Litoribacterium kuwaitense]NGP43749.1 YppE family protein [Litoribacterium kuwaitense]